MKKLYKFHWDCGRQGDLTGIFVADEEEVREAIGKNVYFGEVLGKHSEIFGTLDDGDLKVLTDDQEWIAKFVAFGCASGHNLIAALADQES